MEWSGTETVVLSSTICDQCKQVVLHVRRRLLSANPTVQWSQWLCPNCEPDFSAEDEAWAQRQQQRVEEEGLASVIRETERALQSKHQGG